MDAYLFFLLQILISLAVSLLILRLLSQPLGDLLRRLCPDEAAAIFWQSYTKVMLLLAPLLMALLFNPAASYDDPLGSLQHILLAALGGLLLGLLIIGRQLTRFIAPASPKAAA